MKSNFYSTALSVIFSTIVLLMMYYVNNLEYKYETLKEANVRLISKLPLTDNQVKERQFKEEMYIKQQEKDTTLVLSVIGFSLVFAGIFTFKIFDDRVKIINTSLESSINSVNSRVDAFIESINNKTTNYETDYKNIEHNLYELKNDLNYEASIIKSNEANKLLNLGDFENYLFYTLYSNDYKKKCTIYHKENDVEFSDIIKKSILSDLELTLITLKKSPDFELNGNKVYINNDNTTIMKLINSLNELDDNKIFNTLSNIYSILEFKK